MAKRYLIINTAGRFEIVLEAGRTLYYSSEEKRLVSAELFPRIRQLLSEAQLGINDIDVFGVAIGPGSFTGIRIGVSAVRALAYALDKPVVPVTCFECLSYNITAPATKPFTAVIDGCNGVCYLQNFPSGRGAGSEPVCIRNGDIAGLAIGPIIAERVFTPEIEGCNVAAVGHEGLKAAFEAALDSGRAGHYSAVVPLYLRRSQPEREPGEI